VCVCVCVCLVFFFHLPRLSISTNQYQKLQQQYSHRIMISNPLLVVCRHCLLARLLVPLEKFFFQQQACFPFLSNHGKQAKKQLKKCTTFRHVKHKRSKTKAPKQKQKKTEKRKEAKLKNLQNTKRSKPQAPNTKAAKPKFQASKAPNTKKKQNQRKL
jgi:hypothetical protein